MESVCIRPGVGLDFSFVFPFTYHVIIVSQPATGIIVLNLHFNDYIFEILRELEETGEYWGETSRTGKNQQDRVPPSPKAPGKGDKEARG